MLKILQLGIYLRKTCKFQTYMREDPQGPPPNEFDLGSVEVPDTILPINGSQLETISHIQPLSERNGYGVSLYLDLMSGLHHMFHNQFAKVLLASVTSYVLIQHSTF